MNDKTLNILVLDGGGSKGVYTLGVLKELELKLEIPLCEHFGLIYGTSTGSIIAALIALGHKIPKIEKSYLSLIPKIMTQKTKSGRSKVLKEGANKIFGPLKFNDFKTNIGIVAFNFETQMPLIFKTDIQQTHGMKQSFKPGFDCTIETAVRCSSAAYPFFEKMKIKIDNDEIEVVDGGFIANNSTLYSVIDAYKALDYNLSDINLLNVGVGQYVEKSLSLSYKILSMFERFQFIERVLPANTNSNTLVLNLLFSNLNMLRISDTFTKSEYKTNMLEADIEKLNKMIKLGRASYAKHEKDIVKLLNLK